MESLALETSLATSSHATFTDPSYLPHVPLPVTSPLHESPPPVLPGLQSCINGSYSSPCVIPQSPASVQQLRAPPPLIRAPVQVSMPVMYAPMYYS